MLIIPVLDLKGGQAVHAVRGERDEYRPVRGVLGHGEDVIALAEAYRDRLGCRTQYVADLDAIAGLTGHTALIRSLSDAGLTLWVDAGVSTVDGARGLMELGVARVIIGSETLQSADHFTRLAANLPATQLVLSVDLKEGVLRAPAEFSAPADLLKLAAGHGVNSIILLDLARVGAGAGPPLDLLASLRPSFPDMSLYAGGGVRSRADLEALEQAGAAGALVATAFHRGVLGADDLDQYSVNSER